MTLWHDNCDAEASQQNISERRDSKCPESKPSDGITGDVRELRRVRDSVPWRLWVVAMIEFWERAAFWGLTAPWQNYMESEYPLHHDTNQTPGALGLGQVKATRIYCAFYIFYYVAPLVIAPVADSHLGQYTTLVISVVLYCLGCTALTVSSLPSNLIKGWGLPGLILAMILIGLGGGGFKAIMTPFIADQYTETKPRVMTLKSGEQVVTDYGLTLQYIYNLFFWVGNIGSLSWFATVYIEKQHGFAGAYGLTLGFMVIALLMLLLGRKWYIRSPHKDNVLPHATRIIICAIRNGFNMKHTEPEYQLTHRRKIVPWTSTLVNEITRGLRACRVLLGFVFLWICFDQMQNNLISQAGQMKTGKTPNDMLPAMNQVGCIVLGPLIQEGLYPMLHKQQIYIKPITRITVGFIFITLSMLYATIVQQAIYTSPPCYNHPNHCGYGQWISKWGFKEDRPNVWIQAPLYFLIAAGEIFAVVTGLEYAYDHSPKDMKVLVQAISLLVGGVGSACAMAIAQIAHDPNLVWLYTSLTCGMATTTLVFWLVFRHYDKTHLSNDEDHFPKEDTCDLGKQKNETTNQEIRPSKTLLTASLVVPALSGPIILESRLPGPAKTDDVLSISLAPQLPKNPSPAPSLREDRASQQPETAHLENSTTSLVLDPSVEESAVRSEQSEGHDDIITEQPIQSPSTLEKPLPRVPEPTPATNDIPALGAPPLSSATHRRTTSRPAEDTVPSLVVHYEAMNDLSLDRRGSR